MSVLESQSEPHFQRLGCCVKCELKECVELQIMLNHI